MEELKKHRVSLIIIALLASVKFLIQPLLAWQEQQLTEITMLKAKHDKTIALLNNADAIETQNSLLVDFIDQHSSIFYAENDVGKFQLDRQKWLEDKLAEHGLKSRNIGWTPQRAIEDSQLNGHTVQMNVDGRTWRIINFLQDIQAQEKYVHVQSFNFNLKSQSENTLSTSRTRMNLTFYRLHSSV